MDAAELREAMVARLRERQEIGDDVAGALLAVPRHVFLPEVDPECAYQDEPVVTHRDAEGRPISSSSQPSIMATMLGQLGVEPGHRVLEIGAGTGYNAALLAFLAGPEGRVVSLDLDAGIVEAARRHLDAAGFPRVEVACADGAEGFAARAPYDRVIATVGVWDLAPAWLDQLAPGGRLVAPLDLRGVQASVAMERDGDHWVSRTVAACGFMRMRGPSGGPESLVMLRRDPDLWLALPAARDLGDLLAALGTEPTELAAGLPLPAGATGMEVALWLALHEPRWCMLGGKRGAGYGVTAGLAERDAIAVLGVTADFPAAQDPGRAAGSLVAQGYGPGGAELAAELVAHVRAWDAAGRPETGDLRVAAYRGPAPGGAGLVIPKRHTNLVLTYR
ncbi:MAG: methyltransferase, FxLD system [Nonomuraea sp.]|nr:methyltransferase, FxLD system [Nonomuraea sp.]